MKLPVLDDHIHLSPAGGNVESVRRFERAGGTHCIVVNMPYPGMEVTKAGSFRAQYEETIRLCDLVNENTGVKAFAVIGPYPVELLALAEKWGVERAKEIMMAGVDDAATLIKERRAIGFGEIGRPHFPVPKEIVQASNEIIWYVFTRAREIGCAAVVHTERVSEELYAELAALAEKAGLPKEKVVKHFARTDSVAATNGITPSVLAGREILDAGLFEEPNFMLETDFLDDPARPGAVLDITTIPKRVRKLVQLGVSEEKIWKVMVDLPKKAYGVEID
ncbi:MAG: TatD family hydrolase [Thermoplasmata archaeon]|nr:TatD family hydrolase [Thermoplasmata archaeon]